MEKNKRIDIEYFKIYDTAHQYTDADADKVVYLALPSDFFLLENMPNCQSLIFI